jgi:hypothetical protein
LACGCESCDGCFSSVAGAKASEYGRYACLGCIN